MLIWRLPLRDRALIAFVEWDVAARAYGMLWGNRRFGRAGMPKEFCGPGYARPSWGSCHQCDRVARLRRLRIVSLFVGLWPRRSSATLSQAIDCRFISFCGTHGCKCALINTLECTARNGRR